MEKKGYSADSGVREEGTGDGRLGKVRKGFSVLYLEQEGKGRC